MLPLLRGYAAEDTVLFDRGRRWRADAFCATATATAARLPRARFAINLCDGRAEFLLASAAALIAGHTLVLPPSRLVRTLDELRVAYPDSYCLVDTADASVVPSFALGPELDAVSGAPSAPDSKSPWSPPSIAAAHIAAVLFTSGSTGAPQPHAKTWRTLCEGTQTLLRSFGAPPRGAAILGTVPPQHMFGFETTLMLALQSGTPLLDARPVYPADLALAARTAATWGVAELWLMTTPLQLRAFQRDLPSVPGIRRIISATMPLERELAQAVERDWQTSVEEIFGCTEGGILATRRPAQSPLFTPAAGITFAPDADGATRVSGGHLPQSITLTDRLAPESARFGGEGRFDVMGRDADMVKIAGKRASLIALNRELLAIAGVKDAALFLPFHDAPRLAAIVVAPGRTAEEVRAELAVRIDPAFMPRPLVIVSALSRDANGKVPITYLRALLPSRGSGSSGADRMELLEGSAAIAADHPVFAGHFPSRPIVPGVMLLELVEALLARNGYSVRECPQVKFLAPVSPATPLALRVEITQRRLARFAIDVAGRNAAVGKFLCEYSEAPA